MSSRSKLTIVGLGPGRPEMTTPAALAAISGADKVWFREPCELTENVADASVLDDFYRPGDPDEVFEQRLAAHLASEAFRWDRSVYAVPGSPFVAEPAVVLLQSREDLEVEILSGVSFLDSVWAHVGTSPFSANVRIVDGRSLAGQVEFLPGDSLICNCADDGVLSNIAAALTSLSIAEVRVLDDLGGSEERVFSCSVEDLPNLKATQRTTLWAPSRVAADATQLARLQQIALRLRRDCPWDQEQTHASLSRYLVEESHELLEAIDARPQAGSDTHLIEELGDVLFQVFAHAAIATEEERFRLGNVAEDVGTKLVGRHPHVYGNVSAGSADDVVAGWEINKRKEKNRNSLLEGIPDSLPALLYMWKILRKASVFGFDPAPEDFGEGVGGALALLVKEASRLETEPEEALRLTARAFRRRFEEAEKLAFQKGLRLEELNPENFAGFWSAAKA